MALVSAKTGGYEKSPAEDEENVAATAGGMGNAATQNYVANTNAANGPSANDTDSYFTNNTGIADALSLGYDPNYASQQAGLAQKRADDAAGVMFAQGQAELARGNAAQQQINAIGQDERTRGDTFQSALYNQGQGAVASGNQWAGNVANAGAASNAMGLSAVGRADQFAQNQTAQGNYLFGQGAGAAARGALQGDFGAQTNALGAAQGYGGALAGLESTEGPSAAQAQLNAATSRGLDDALTLARSGRGPSGSAAATAQAAGRAAPALAANAANQSAQLRAQENALWRARQGQNLANAGQIQLGAAGQLGGQSEAQLNAALQSRAQNDSAQQNLTSLGINSTQNAATNMGNAYGQAINAFGQNINAQTNAGQLAGNAQQTGLAATQNAYNVGANGGNAQLNAAVAGYGAGAQGGAAGMQGTQGAYNIGQSGQTLGLQTEQAALGGRQQQVANMLQEYGIKNDLAINQSNQLTNMIGAGVGAAATAGAMMSDERQKVKLSSPVTGNPYGRTGAPGSDFGPRDKSDLTPYGHAGRGAFDSAQRQSVEGPAKAEAERERRLSAAITAAGNTMRQGIQAGGGPMRSHSGPVPVNYQPVQFGTQPLMSDERSKNKIADLEAQLAEYRGGGAPDFSKSPNSLYVYKDPTLPGAAPGVQYGPMAQDLEKAGSEAVFDAGGTKMVDPGRLSMETAGAVGETQARQDDIERQFEELRAMMRPKRREARAY